MILKNFAYAFRGWILAIVALIVILQKPAKVNIIAMIIIAVIFLFAIGLRIYARKSIGEHTRKNKYAANKLVTWGAYSKIRHPLYVSNFFVASSLILLHLGFSIISLPFILAVLIFEIVLSINEDDFFKKKFGKEWEEWANCTHAFFFSKNKIRDTHKHMRTTWRAFCLDYSTWFWLIICIVIIILKKIYVFS